MQLQISLAMGLIEKEHQWILRMWCLAHRLELSLKDCLSGTVFDSIDEMLIKLYYLYEKKPKKCPELEELVSELGEFISFTDRGLRPVHASGSRWICHKINAMRRILSKYGAYTMHLTALSEDRSVCSTDRAKLQGYCEQWVDCKYVLGCALFVDLLNPCAAFSKAMQAEEIDILGALMGLLRSLKEIEKLASLPLSGWPTYAISCHF